MTGSLCKINKVILGENCQLAKTVISLCPLGAEPPGEVKHWLDEDAQLSKTKVERCWQSCRSLTRPLVRLCTRAASALPKVLSGFARSEGRRGTQTLRTLQLQRHRAMPVLPMPPQQVASDAKQVQNHKQAANSFTLLIKLGFVLLQGQILRGQKPSQPCRDRQGCVRAPFQEALVG